MSQHQDNQTNSEHNPLEDAQEITTTEEVAQAEDISTLEAQEQDKINELEQKIGELKDLYLRSQAEMQNLTKRNAQEIKKARDYSVNSFAREIVTIKDYLEMALMDQSNSFDTLKMGVDLTLKQLIQVFDRQNIKEIAPKSKDKFDPHLHHAIDTIEGTDQESNTIVEVKQKGYKINELVLRPANVSVAK